MFLVLIISLLLSFQPVDPYQSIVEQANVYIENIEQGNQKDVNFWGLNELYASNCKNNKIVSRQISQSKSALLQIIYNSYECDVSEDQDSLKLERFKYYALETQSFSIAVHYLTQSDSQEELEKFYNDFIINYKNITKKEIEFLNKIISRKPFIDINDLDIIQKPFILYSLLFSDYVSLFLDTSKIESLINRLLIDQNRSKSNFDASLSNFNLLKAAYEINRYQFISSIFNDIIESKLYPNSEKKVGILSGLDYSLSITGNYSESLYLQRNILIPLADYYKLKIRLDYTLIQQSANLYELGKFYEAKKILERLYNDPNSSIPKSLLYNNLSINYQKLGQNNQYISFLLQAIQEIESNKLEQSNYYTVKLGLLRNLFVYYNSIGDSTNAISFINKAKSLAEKESDENELAAIYLYLGNYYWDNFEDAEKALTQYDKAEKIFDTNDNYRRKITTLINKSSLLIKIDSLEKVKDLVSEVKLLSSNNSDTPNYLESLIFEAEISFLENNLLLFQSLLKKIRTYSLENLEFEVLIKYHNLHATLLHKKNLNREAYSYFKPIIDQIIDRAKGSVDTQTGFWTVEEEYLDAFELMISILTGLESTQESIAYLDRLKTINDASLYNNPLLRANKLTEKELAEEKKITAQIQKLRNAYLSASSSEESSLKTEIDKLSAQKQVFVNKVNNAKSEHNLPLWKIQQQIPGNELILHYTELNNNLYVSSISKSSIDIEILPLNSEVKALLTNTANDLASGKTSLLNLFEVFNFLNLQDIPDHITQISVIPDNELYRIPLDVLPTNVPNSAYSFGSAHYLIEDFDFKYFTSLQDYAENNRIPSNDLKNDFSAFAISYFDDFKEKSLPSLPFATNEVREIQEVLTAFKHKRVFSGNNATEEAFQKQLNTSRILHVATHSEVSTQDPLFSTIYLKSAETNGTKGDALYAYELFDNQLNNELIMLNSCSSGTGNYLQGTGIMGISRALRYAGAKSLALNLWEVNDKIASEFATDFYYFLNEGFSKSESMRFAKINQIKTGSADPHYWGAYTLIGNSSPIIKKPTSSQYVLPFLLTVGLLVGYKVRSKSDNSY